MNPLPFSISPSLAIGLATQAVTVGTTCALLLRPGAARPAATPLWRAALPWCAALLSLLPVGDASLAEWLRGLWNDLSFTTLQLCLLAWWAPGRRGAVAPLGRAGLVALALAGVALYPTALGAGPIDLYRFGFQPWGLLALLAVAGLALCRRTPLLTLILAVDVAAYALRLSDSDNLWDYLLDVPLFCYTLIALIRPLARRRPPQPALRPGTE